MSAVKATKVLNELQPQGYNPLKKKSPEGDGHV